MAKKQPEKFDTNLDEQTPAEELDSLLKSQENSEQPQTESKIKNLEARVASLEKFAIHIIKQQPRTAEIIPELESSKIPSKKLELPAWQQKPVGENQKTPEKKKKPSLIKIVAIIFIVVIVLYVISNWSAIMSYFG